MALINLTRTKPTNPPANALVEYELDITTDRLSTVINNYNNATGEKVVLKETSLSDEYRGWSTELNVDCVELIDGTKVHFQCFGNPGFAAEEYTEENVDEYIETTPPFQDPATMAGYLNSLMQRQRIRLYYDCTEASANKSFAATLKRQDSGYTERHLFVTSLSKTTRSQADWFPEQTGNTHPFLIGNDGDIINMEITVEEI